MSEQPTLEVDRDIVDAFAAVDGILTPFARDIQSLRAAVAAQAVELAALREDKARLDWLEEQALRGYTGLGEHRVATTEADPTTGERYEREVFCVVREKEGDQYGSTLREAIDAARRAAI